MKSVTFPSVRPPSSERGRRTYRVVVEYDGTAFAGFQFQPLLRTIAGTLESALAQVFEQPIKVSAAGRTDAGVHASGQVISFSGHDRFPVDRLCRALQAVLPGDISVRDAAIAPEGFSARNSALERAYRYLVLARPEPSALLQRFVHHDYRPLDVVAMERAATDLLGTHDFVSFCGELPERGPTLRTLTSASVRREASLVRLEFRATGFLHRMVRVMTGTLLEIGAGRRPPDAIATVLAARDRTAAGFTAPPQGLYLIGVRYADFSSERSDEPVAGELLARNAQA